MDGKSTRRSVVKTGHYILSGIMLAAYLFITQNGYAVVNSIKNDPTAMFDYRGTAFFSAVGGLDVTVDYAVYAPGAYNHLIVPNTDRYVYAYQVFNNAGSKVAVDYFSVGFPADTHVFPPQYDPVNPYAVPGGILPMSYLLSQQVMFMFLFDAVDEGEHSQTLLFTSEDGPDMGKGVVSGGITGGAIVDVPSPSPVPEPATLALLGLGLAFGLGKKRHAGDVTPLQCLNITPA
jgi:hypothetical protein